MNFLVTGATGFIGTSIVEQLLRSGHRVVAFSNQAMSPFVAEQLGRLDGELVNVEGDVRDQAAIRDELLRHKVSHVLHGAVVTSDSHREQHHGSMIIDINLAGTASVVTAAGEVGVEKFVYLGSAGVYSEELQPDGMILTEDVPHQVSTLYGISKSAAEGIVARVATLWNLPYAIGRIGTAFGPWEHQTGFRDTMSPIYQLTRMAHCGERAIIPFDKNKNWHYSRDAAAALITLATERTSKSVYNLGPEECWPLSAWAKLLRVKFPVFDFSISQPGNVEVYGEVDGGRLSWQLFDGEFGPTARHGLHVAFNDYMAWLQDRDVFSR
ncbi:NAD(P)-dependent oxidoreductase [Rhizobium pusense]|uniref:NAD-dependent epimerase/dehydratase family protein n=1 Tax=Agrobacterium pusense TaxID=648995 RepID=UPI00244C17C1|nr:NAD(P)-dependent oxidoreductase [Agrobacterium pusense]MDH2091612.1 NAD(P)-dependent oxidoreductase [Agrobacterium pusense]